MKNVSEVIERIKTYEPLWNGWRFTGKLIGSGGSGCVLELSNGNERSVVKVIHVENNLEKYNAVKNEIETMVTLRSNSLVECLDYRVEEVFNRKGEPAGHDFLIRMNRYEPFSEFLREEDYDPNALCVQLTLEIGVALCVLHSHGILHRDVKPENIFIENTDGKQHFRLGDFGVSKRISDMSGLTTTGTLNFMAPESYQYNEYSYRSDIYNFGMTLYYILNDLRFPRFTEETSQSDIDVNTDCRLRGDKLPEPKLGNERLQSVVLKACEAKPKNRYKDVSEMLGDLFGQTIERVGIEKSKEPSDRNNNINKYLKLSTFREIAHVFVSKKSLVSVAALLLASVLTVVSSEISILFFKQDFKQQVWSNLNSGRSLDLNKYESNPFCFNIFKSTVSEYADVIISNYNEEKIPYQQAHEELEDINQKTGIEIGTQRLENLSESKFHFIQGKDALQDWNVNDAVESFAWVIPEDTNYDKAQKYIDDLIDLYIVSDEECLEDIPMLWYADIFTDSKINVYKNLKGNSKLEKWKKRLGNLLFTRYEDCLQEFELYIGPEGDSFTWEHCRKILDTYVGLCKINNALDGVFDDLVLQYQRVAISSIDNVFRSSEIRTFLTRDSSFTEHSNLLHQYIDELKPDISVEKYQEWANILNYIESHLPVHFLDLLSTENASDVAWWLVDNDELYTGNEEFYLPSESWIEGFSVLSNKPLSGNVHREWTFPLQPRFSNYTPAKSLSGTIDFLKGTKFKGKITFIAERYEEKITLDEFYFDLTKTEKHDDLDFYFDISNYESITMTLDVYDIPSGTIIKADEDHPYRSPYKFYIINGEFSE